MIPNTQAHQYKILAITHHIVALLTQAIILFIAVALNMRIYDDIIFSAVTLGVTILNPLAVVLIWWQK